MNGNRATVFLADDDVNVSTLAAELLKAEYDVVGIASDGEDALQKILELAPDFAVLDISMPQMDGLSVGRQLRRAECATKVVFLTLIDDEDYVDAAKQVGHGYVLKRRLSLDLLPALEGADGGDFFRSS